MLIDILTATVDIPKMIFLVDVRLKKDFTKNTPKYMIKYIITHHSINVNSHIILSPYMKKSLYLL